MQAEMESLRQRGLYPHQAEFVAGFLRPGAPRYQQLVAPAGSGRGAVVREMVSRLAAECDASHIPILTQRLDIEECFAHLLAGRTGRVPTRRVDGQVLRELAAGVPAGSTLWEQPIVALLQVRLATRKSVADAIAQAAWDLMIVDGELRLSSAAKQLISRLMEHKSAERILWTSATPDSQPFSGFVRSVWDFDLVDWDGRPLFRPPPTRHVVEFERTLEEVAFLRQQLDASSEDAAGFEPIVSRLLITQAASSLYAIEQALVRRRNRLAHGMPDPLNEDDLDHDLAEGEDGAPTPAIEAIEAIHLVALRRVASLLDALDRVSADAKLESFLELVARLRQGPALSRIIVFSSYVATASYLLTSLEEVYDDAYSITGATSFGHWAQLLWRFQEAGGVLVTTSAILTGLELGLRDIDAGIHFDLPQSRLEFHQREAVLARGTPGGKPADVYFIRDSSGILPSEVEDLQAILADPPRSPSSV